MEASKWNACLGHPQQQKFLRDNKDRRCTCSLGKHESENVFAIFGWLNMYSCRIGNIVLNVNGVPYKTMVALGFQVRCSIF